MKRNVMISGEFEMTELTNTTSATKQTAKKTPLPKKATERIEALRKAGIDVSGYFAMNDEQIVRIENNVPHYVEDDDPIFATIAEQGYIGNYKLYRRWVMAQMFRMLRNMDNWNWDMTKCIQSHGYEYSWKMVENELRDQYKMYKHGDMQSYYERNTWFNKAVVMEMARDYMNKLYKYVDGLTVRYCKGKPYKTIRGIHFFTNEIHEKVFMPIMRCVEVVNKAKTPQGVYEAVRNLNLYRVQLHWGEKLPEIFINAYKGAGGFFTMKNLIMFHGCRFFEGSKKLSVDKSLAALDCYTSEYKNEGWRMIGVMKELMDKNNISIRQKQQEWSDAKRK
jgi:hypothetical protein